MRVRYGETAKLTVAELCVSPAQPGDDARLGRGAQPLQLGEDLRLLAGEDVELLGLGGDRPLARRTVGALELQLLAQRGELEQLRARFRVAAVRRDRVRRRRR